MKNSLIPSLVLCFFPLLLSAGIPEGSKNLRLGYSRSSAEKLWKKKDASPTYFGNNGKTIFQTYSLGVSYGLLANLQLDGKIAYSATEMDKGSEGGSTQGDDRNQISEIFIAGKYDLVSKEMMNFAIGLGFKHPGKEGPSSNYEDSPDVFIAPNDGTIQYSLLTDLMVRWTDWFNTQALIKYVARTGEPKDQIVFELLFPFIFLQKYTIGIGFNWLETLGGPDIGTPAFAAQVGTRSGGNSKVKAFSIVNEEVFGVSMFAGMTFSEVWSVDVYWNKKLSGRNTDISTSFGLGISRFFY